MKNFKFSVGSMSVFIFTLIYHNRKSALHSFCSENVFLLPPHTFLSPKKFVLLFCHLPVTLTAVFIIDHFLESMKL